MFKGLDYVQTVRVFEHLHPSSNGGTFKELPIIPLPATLKTEGK